MHETVLPDDKNSPAPKRRVRRPKATCAKCEKSQQVDKIPEGWITIWNTKLARFVHQCPDCQIRRSRK